MGNSRFKRGIMRQSAPTKNELVEMYDERMKALSNALQQLLAYTSKQNQTIATQIQEIAKQLEVADYRSLATMEMLETKGMLTVEQHSKHVEDLKIKNFDEQSAKDDEIRKLTAATGPAKIGQWATLRLSAVYGATIEVPSIKDAAKDTATLTNVNGGATEAVQPKETIANPNAGKAIEKFAIIRSKVQLGSGQLHPLLEQPVVGMNTGETKEFDLLLPQEFRELAGQTVKFKVELFSIKEEPKPAVVATPVPMEATNETASEIQGAA